MKIFYETNENNELEIALWLVLNLEFRGNFCDTKDVRQAARRLIREFFIVPKRNLFDENEDIEIEEDDNDCKSLVRGAFASTVERLYQSLEAAHRADDCSVLYANDYIQHEFLKVKLKPYQVQTIKWMLSRERVPKYHTNGFIEIKKRSTTSEDESVKFFYNPETCTLTTDPDIAEPVLIPTGGILAEEMGMGKTIEVLDLILLNPRPLKKTQFPMKTTTTERSVTKADVRCLCVGTKMTDTVWCTKCSKVQHRKCVDQQNSDITPDVSYMCPACWENEKPIPVKTTFIVSPQSIKMQWKTEIDNRIKSGTMSVSLSEFRIRELTNSMILQLNPLHRHSYMLALNPANGLVQLSWQATM